MKNTALMLLAVLTASLVLQACSTSQPAPAPAPVPAPGGYAGGK